MTHQFDVLIVGGGIVGLTAAIGMSEKGYAVAVIDAGALKPELSTSGARVYAINQASKQLLQNLNVWTYLDQTRVSPYQKMHVWDAFNGAVIDFNSRLVASAQLGDIIEESVIKQALLQKIETLPGIQLFNNRTIDSVIQNKDSITVGCHEEQWQGQLLMVADGGNSPTREQLKVALTSWSYHQRAIVATVKTEQPHQQTAWQVFHPEGPLAFLPLKDQHHCSIVWSTTPAKATHLMSLSDEQFNEALAKSFSEKLGHTEVLSQRVQFPLRMRHAKQYSGERWLLLGDAAHTIHPLAGLGLNVGLADVASWLNQLPPQKTVYFKKHLGAYQRERKSDVWKIILLMDAIKGLFSNPLPPIKALRAIGLSCCNQLPLLKRLFIHQAMGE